MTLVTSLHPDHLALKARMVPFAGWDMPVSYPIGTASEVRACRSGVGLFDVSHMGELIVSGAQATDFLQFVSTNDVSKLAPGSAQYSLLLNDSGGVKDDIIIYHRTEDEYMVVVNASCHEKDRDWIIAKSEAFNVSTADISDKTALIAVQGPEAVALMSALTGRDLSTVKRFGLVAAEFSKFKTFLARTGYTGEDGFEIFCDWNEAREIWKRLVDAGATPCGLGARDVLRLEAAYPLYGHELDETHTPLESGTGWATKPAKGEFVGREGVAKQKKDGVAMALVGLKMSRPNAIPRDGCGIETVEGVGPIGMITSGTLSPTVGGGIALARIHAEHGGVGTELIVDIRGRKVGASVVKLPFYRNGV